MRHKKIFTVKEWKRFKKIQVKVVKGVQCYLDVQEVMCKKYDIVLTNHKTKREQLLIFLKKINMKNINKGIDTFNNAVQSFGRSMDQLSKDLGGSTERQSTKDKENLKKILNVFMN